MKRAVAAFVLAFAASTVSAGQALATGCTQTGFERDGINLTAALINPGDVTGMVNAASCNIGVYYGPGSKGKVAGANVFGANYFGIVNDGGNVDVKNSSVHNIGEVPFNGTQHGVAIYFTGGATGSVQKTAVSLYQKGGIVVNGTGSSANIQGNTVTGAGPISYIAQNGIQVSRGATGDVSGNMVSGNAYTGPNGASSAGILIFGGCEATSFGGALTTDVNVEGNSLTNNDVGIWLFNGNAACDAQTSTPTRNSARKNMLSNDAVTNKTGFDADTGYQAGIADVGNQDEISGNKISGLGYTPENDDTAVVIPIDIAQATNPSLHKNTVPS